MPRLVQDSLICGLLLALLAPPAFAARDLHCEGPDSLRAKVRDCEGNLAYARAGKACLDAYDRSVLQAREALAKALGDVLEADKQSQAMSSAKKGYDSAIRELGALVDAGRRLGQEALVYKKELVFPEDFGAAGAAGLPAEIFLENQNCYAATRKLVETYAEILSLHAKELELTRQVAAALAAKAFRGEGKLKREDVLPLLTQAQPGEATGGSLKKPAAGKKGKGQSDITGTKKGD